MAGVLRTRVGYAGGTSLHPTYRNMGNHTETIQIDYEPSIISFEEILEVFWKSHNPFRSSDAIPFLSRKSRQYMSIILYHDDIQRELAITTKKHWEQTSQGEIQTELQPSSQFFMAENDHQKYYLKRYTSTMEKLKPLYPSHEDFVNSTFIARLNGLAGGYGTLDGMKKEIHEWKLNPSERLNLLDVLNSIHW
jgi:peptide-methionine (S)-S-oxide reductase